jgi:hypothetical protein
METKLQYNEHIELLAEWNEDNSFYPTSTAILMTELGVQVVQDVQERTIVERYADGTRKLSDDYRTIHVWAIYGDEDELKRLCIADNEGGREAYFYVNNTIRS